MTEQSQSVSFYDREQAISEMYLTERQAIWDGEYESQEARQEALTAAWKRYCQANRSLMDEFLQGIGRYS